MEHYKLDWHRFNLKQKILGASPVSAGEFEKKTGAGEKKQAFSRKAAKGCLRCQSSCLISLFLICRRPVKYLRIRV